MIITETEKHQKKGFHISLSLLISIVIVFIIGLVAGLVIKNFLDQQNIALSTQSLISFVFTIALGSAAIVLAIITIVLSRSAENALIHRSDEGIRLQNEVFVRTSEVLSSIKTSTGVTEKRLEDMLSGRSSIIVRESVSKALLERKYAISKEDIEKIKHDLSESLRSEIIPLLSSTPEKVEGRLREIETQQEKNDELFDRWEKFRKSIINKLSKKKELKLISETAGSLSAKEPNEFWDGMYQLKEKLIGLEINTEEQIKFSNEYLLNWQYKNQREDFVERIGANVMRHNIDLAFIIIDKDIWSVPLYEDIVEYFKNFNELSKSKIIIMSGNPEKIANEIYLKTSEII